MPKPILVLQHHAIETPGVFAEVLAARGWSLRTVRPDRGEPLPDDPGEFAGLLVMGGPMGVYEDGRYPWLRDEDRLLRAAIGRGCPALGICLGSQLIAKAAGARVAPGPVKEIGWYPLDLTAAGRADALLGGFPPTFEAFEWHGDAFDLPPDAVGLASSALYPHQAFRLGRSAYGLLFHLEVTAAMVGEMTRTFTSELDALGDPGRPQAVLDNLERRVKPLNDLARRLFEGWLGLAART
ncbi:MAG TPA: type 1 glutamine amidotransferase [Methylomirabilota bacterium]|nr:type 1 glutamine amidotransferase [Methylomirabilota bacterium]